MPDSALEDTERQFSDLLGAAARDIPVCLKFYSLPGIARSDRVQEHLSRTYFAIDDLWRDQFDGVIITGTEPCQPDLRSEPYWFNLVDIFDWVERNTASVVLSCLAAHAGVLYADGVDRHALSDKRFGVFDEQRVCDHALTRGGRAVMRFPHSRWNELQENVLTSAGYVVLTKSAEAGVNLFVKKKRQSLFVHFQGHPEYGVQTLLKEYRRDIVRFLRHERETYPSMPRGQHQPHF
jgi:homoserine O-succinyltransferase